MVEIEEVSDGPPESKPVATSRGSKQVYSRAVLLSFADREACKRPPQDLDASILKEIAESGIPIPHAGTRGRRDLEGDGGHGRDSYSRSPQDVPEWRKDSSWRAGSTAGPGQQQPPLLGQHRRRSAEEEGIGGAFSSSYPPRPTGSWESNGPRDNQDRHVHRPAGPGHGPPPHGSNGPQGIHGRWDNRPGPGERERERERERGFRGYRNVEEESGEKGRPEPSARRLPGGTATATAAAATGGQVSLRPGWSHTDQAADTSASKEKAPGRGGVSSSPPNQGGRYLGPPRAGRVGGGYQPSSRPKEEYPDHETFGEGETKRNERLELERKRREEFEMMRVARHRQATEQKLKDQETGGKKKHDIDSLWDPDTFSAEDPSSVPPAPTRAPVPVPVSPAVSESASVTGPPRTPPRPAVPPGFAKPGGLTAASGAPSSPTPSIRNGQTGLGVPPGFNAGFNGSGTDPKGAAANKEASLDETKVPSDAETAKTDATIKAARSAEAGHSPSAAAKPRPVSPLPAQPAASGSKSAQSKSSESDQPDAASAGGAAVPDSQQPSADSGGRLSTRDGAPAGQAAGGNIAADSTAARQSSQSGAAGSGDGKAPTGEESDRGRAANEGLGLRASAQEAEAGVSEELGPAPPFLADLAQSSEQGKEPAQEGQQESVLTKLFRQAGADLAVRSGMDPTTVNVPEEEKLVSQDKPSRSSKFARWFITPEDGGSPVALPDSSASPEDKGATVLGHSSLGGLAEALKAKQKGPEPGSGSSPWTAAPQVLPMPQGPSLEDVEKGLSASGLAHGQIPPAQIQPPSAGPLSKLFGLGSGGAVPQKAGPNVLPGGQVVGSVGGLGKGPPRFMTLEDIEQSILAEAGAGGGGAGGGSTGSTGPGTQGAPQPAERPVSSNQPGLPQPRDSASQHLLALLRKGTGGGGNPSGPPAGPFSANPQPPGGSGLATGQGAGSAVLASLAKLPDQASPLSRFGAAWVPQGGAPPPPISRPSPGPRGPISPIGPVSRPNKAGTRTSSEQETPGSALSGRPWLSPLMGFQQPLPQPTAQPEPVGVPGSSDMLRAASRGGSGTLAIGMRLEGSQSGAEGTGTRGETAKGVGAAAGQGKASGEDAAGSAPNGPIRGQGKAEGSRDAPSEGEDDAFPEKDGRRRGPLESKEDSVGGSDSAGDRLPDVASGVDGPDRGGWNPLAGSLGFVARPMGVAGARSAEPISRPAPESGMAGIGKSPLVKAVGPSQRASGSSAGQPEGGDSRADGGVGNGDAPAPLSGSVSVTGSDSPAGPGQSALGGPGEDVSRSMPFLSQPGTRTSGPGVGSFPGERTVGGEEQPGAATGPLGAQPQPQPQSQSQSQPQLQPEPEPAVARGWTPFGMPGSGGSGARSHFMEDLLARGRPSLGSRANGVAHAGDPNQEPQKAPGQAREHGQGLPQFHGAPQAHPSLAMLQQQQQQQPPPPPPVNMLSFQGHPLGQQHFAPLMQQQQQRVAASLQAAAFHRNSAIPGLPPGLMPLHESARGGGGGGGGGEGLPYALGQLQFLSPQAHSSVGPRGYQALTGQSEPTPSFFGGAPLPQGVPPGMQQRAPFFAPMPPPFMQGAGPEMRGVQPIQHGPYGARYSLPGTVEGSLQGLYQGPPPGGTQLASVPMQGAPSLRQMPGADVASSQAAVGTEHPVGKVSEAGPGQGLDRWFGTGAEFGRRASAMPGVGKAPPQMMGLEELERQLRMG